MEEKIIYDVEVKGVQSIENLTKANKELREERKKLDLQSEAGLKRAKEINQQLDKNTEVIKNNSSALEKQRLNVGNYTGALDKLVPGLGATANGFTSMRTTAMAFIATPIGAVIGALGLALGALITYIKGSDAAGDRFAKTTATLGFVFENLKLIVEDVGGFIFDTIEFIAGGVEKVIGILNPAAGAAIAAAKKAGEELAALQDEIEDKENDFLVKRAETNEKVQALREKAITQEGALKKKTIEEAIALEKSLAAEETKLAEQKLLAFQIENKARIENDALDTEQKKELRQLEADIINQRSQGAQATIKFQKEVEKLREEELKRQEKLNEQRAIEIQQKKDLADINERLNEQTDIELPKLELKIKGQDTMNKALDGLIKKNQEVSKSEKQRVKDAEDSSDKQVKAAVALSAAVIGLGKSDTKAKKALGLSTIAINSGIGVSEAIKAGAGKPWPLNLAAILSGITAVLTGITQAKGLLGFASGGLTGTKIMAHHGTRINRSNGDNLLATVKTGEVILNRDQQARLGGDRTFASIGVPGFASGGFVAQTAKNTESISSQIQLYEAISRIQPVVTVEDINAGQSRVSVIQNRAQVI